MRPCRRRGDATELKRIDEELEILRGVLLRTGGGERSQEAARHNQGAHVVANDTPLHCAFDSANNQAQAVTVVL